MFIIVVIRSVLINFMRVRNELPVFMIKKK